jgi:hypothetical protein
VETPASSSPHAHNTRAAWMMKQQPACTRRALIISSRTGASRKADCEPRAGKSAFWLVIYLYKLYYIFRQRSTNKLNLLFTTGSIFNFSPIRHAFSSCKQANKYFCLFSWNLNTSGQQIENAPEEVHLFPS